MRHAARKFVCVLLMLAMFIAAGTVSGAPEEAAAGPAAAGVEYDKAAKLTETLGIFTGGGGTDWTTALTRAQAATLLTRLRGVDATKLTATSNSFVDLEPWAEPYVAYAEREGLIVGVGDGRFDPQGELSGYQWALMLLRLLGYADKSEGISGENWQAATARLASQTGLDKNIANMGAILSRKQAAQMILNALRADLVVYADRVDVNSTVSDGELAVSGGRTTETTVRDWGSAIDSKRESNGNFAVQLGERLYQGRLQRVENQYDNYGRPNCESWLWNGDEVVILADDRNNLFSSYVTSVTYGDLYSDLGTSVALSDSTSFHIWEDGRPLALNEADFYPSLLSRDSAAVLSHTGRGIQTEVYCEYRSDAVIPYYEVNIIIIHTYIAAATLAYDKTQGTLAINTAEDQSYPGTLSSYTLSSADIIGLEGFAARDKLLYTAYWNGSAENPKYIVDTVSAPTVKKGVSVSSFSVDSGDNRKNSVVADKVNYYYSADRSENSSFLFLMHSYEINGGKYDLYLDAFDNIVYAVRNSSDDRYFYIREVAADGPFTDSVSARAVNVKGKAQVISISNVNQKSVSLAEARTLVGTWVRYTEDDGKYRLSTLSLLSTGNESQAISPTVFDKSVTVYQNLGSQPIRVGSETKFIVYHTTSKAYSSYTGVEKLPNIVSSSAAAVVREDGLAQFVYIQAGRISNTTDLSWAFVYDTTCTNSYDAEEGAYTSSYPAIIQGEKSTLVLLDPLTGSEPGLYYWTATKDDHPTGLALAADGNARFHAAEYDRWRRPVYGANILMCGGESFAINDGAQVWRIDEDGEAQLTSVAEAIHSGDGKIYEGMLYVVYKSETDHTVDELYFLDLGSMYPEDLP